MFRWSKRLELILYSVGGTVTGVTGQYGKPVGDALTSVTDGVEKGTNSVAKGVEDAGKGEKSFF